MKLEEGSLGHRIVWALGILAFVGTVLGLCTALSILAACTRS